jgi:hypothetical protein
LQPLDVGIFGPLAQAYSEMVLRLVQDSIGKVTTSKALFWGLFKPAFDKAFTESNIKSAFAKCGIEPPNEALVLEQIKRPETPPSLLEEGDLEDPVTNRRTRRFYNAYRLEPTRHKTEVLFDTLLHIQAKLAIQEHVNRGLMNAITQQKKKNRGNPIKLNGDADQGQPELHDIKNLRKIQEF